MQHDHSGEGKAGWKDWLWMAACCLPMIAITEVTSGHHSGMAGRLEFSLDARRR